MTDTATAVGNAFVANYPPFPFWSGEHLDDLAAVTDRPPVREAPLGLYVHVPFCRKRCTFCYFKVFTGIDAATVRAYVDAVTAEAATWSRKAVVQGRTPSFVYIGGGTPSFLSVPQLEQLFEGLRTALPWADDAEVTFECEPGTLRQDKVDALARLGVTRLSLGVESFDDDLLQANGRAHRAQHIVPAYEMARSAGIPQVNLDLIAGMIGSTQATWEADVAETIRLAPDSVTIYQMEIPGNTGIARAIREGSDLPGHLSDAATKRRWVAEAFQALEGAGYTLCSGYTAVRGDPDGRFVYRDSLWRGADLLGMGVSAFGHVQGVHLQNTKHLGPYVETATAGHLPLARGHAMTDEERFVREWILQLKLGAVDPRAFTAKFGVDPLERYADVLADLADQGLVTITLDQVVLSRDALLQVDRLLPRFFLQEHGGPAARLAPVPVETPAEAHG